jgi:uncharacterized membrane protein YdjX (TVP38/TMEM64 family)
LDEIEIPLLTPLLKRLLRTLDAFPIYTVLVMRLIFFMAPFLNAVLGLTSVKFRDYIVASAIGVAPLLAALIMLNNSLITC